MPATESSTPLGRMSLHAFGCPDCTQPFQIDSSQAGQQVRCPGCSAVVQIPDSLEIPETVESPPQPEEVPEAFACPACESAFGVLASMYGTTMACPHCGQAVSIERDQPSPAPQIAAAKSGPPVDDAAKSMIAAQQRSDSLITTEETALSEQAAESQEDAEPEIAVFEQQNVDHLLPPRFATLDPAFLYRRGNSSDQVLLPQADGGVQAVSNRIVTIVHNGQEYQLISSPRYRRNLDIAVNAMLILIALLLMLAIWWAVA